MQVRLEILVIEIEADVAVEFAIVVIAGIALDGAPDLLGRFGVAGQARRRRCSGHRIGRIDAVARPRLGEENAVRVGEEIANAAFAQQLIDARRVAALRQPDALRPSAEMPLELAAADLDLGPTRVLVVDHQRQKAVRRAAGDQFELAGLEEAAKAVEEVVAVLLDEDIAGPR